MYRRHGQKLGLVFLACDLLVTAGIWFVAYFIRYALLPAPYGVPNSVSVATGLPMVLLMAAAAYRLCGLYEVHRLRELPARSVGSMPGQRAAVPAGHHRHVLPPRSLHSRLGMAVFLAQRRGPHGRRRLLWQVLKVLRSRGLNYGRAVIVGTGAPDAWSAKRSGPTVGPDWKRSALSIIQPGTIRSYLPRLGTIDQLGEIVERHTWTTCSSRCRWRYGQLPEVYGRCKTCWWRCSLVPDLPNLAGMRVRNARDRRRCVLEPARQSALRLGQPRQAQHGSGAGHRGARCCRAADAAAGRADQGHQSRAGALSSAADGPGRTHVRHAQVPQHASSMPSKSTGPVWATVATSAARRWAVSCAAGAWMNCRSCSTCWPAT